MLTIRRKEQGYNEAPALELEWARQTDPFDSKYSCWSPDRTREGAITIPISMLEDAINALKIVSSSSGIKEILLDE